jgi:pyruvate/2-oxoglutarate dehydrogenase complex dihydrolipoamide acyltransferase (E2) component
MRICKQDTGVNIFSAYDRLYCLQVEVRPIMVVALTYDHRLIDGREAVTFLVKVKNAIEDPRTMLLNL